MKKVLLFAFATLVGNAVFSQSDKQLTHYMFDKMSYNPATTGFKGYCGALIYRGQWDKVQDAPNTMLFNVQGNLQKYNSGVGLSFMNDVIGYGREMEINLNYAYHLEVPGAGYLSAGLGLGIENVGFDPKWNAPQTGTDVTLDPNLPLGSSGTAFNANFGLNFTGNEHYYVGLSMTHLTAPTLKNVNFTKARHYYISAGYEIRSAYQNWAWFLPSGLSLKPSVLFKSDMTASVLDVNLLADFWVNNDLGVYGGATFRNGKTDAAALMIGFMMKRYNQGTSKGALGGDPDVLKIGYSYDLMTGPLSQYGYGTHEIMFNYCVFPPPPPVTRYGNVFILQ